MTIEVKQVEAYPIKDAEPEFPYLARHSNKGDTILLVTGKSEKDEMRRDGVILEEGYSPLSGGWGLEFIEPLTRGSAVMLVQK